MHVAFIMDGNGRWAKRRGLPRHLGHKAGCDRIVDIYEECLAQDIKAMSLYAFSTENWNRPKSEINHLFKYLEIFFKKEIDRIIKDGSRVMVSGDISRLPAKTQKVINDALACWMFSKVIIHPTSCNCLFASCLRRDSLCRSLLR